jgi:arginyl-tRNA synthetase
MNFQKVYLIILVKYCQSESLIFTIAGEIQKIHMDRLILCEAAANILRTGFQILGLKPVEKM